MLHFMGIDTLQLNPFCSWGEEKPPASSVTGRMWKWSQRKEIKRLKNLDVALRKAPLEEHLD